MPLAVVAGSLVPVVLQHVRSITLKRVAASRGRYIGRRLGKYWSVLPCFGLRQGNVRERTMNTCGRFGFMDTFCPWPRTNVGPCLV